MIYTLILNEVLDHAFGLYHIILYDAYLNEAVLVLEVFQLVVLWGQVVALWVKGVHVYRVPPYQILKTLSKAHLSGDKIILKEMVDDLEILQVIAAHVRLLYSEFQIKNWRSPIRILKPSSLK